jgi:hypothetical protein
MIKVKSPGLLVSGHSVTLRGVEVGDGSAAPKIRNQGRVAEKPKEIGTLVIG